MSRTPLAALAAALLLSGACLDTTGSNAFTLDFDATAIGSGEGWIALASDFPEDRLTEVDLVGDHRGLPPAVSPTAQGLYQSATNVTGNLFVLQKKYLSNFFANTSYEVSMQVQYVTNYGEGCSTGPGPLVVIKAGLTSIEPLAIADGQGVLQLNLDKGVGAAEGQFAQLGDLRNGQPGCASPGAFAATATSTGSQTQTLTTDAFGGFWVFVGTQSAFAGRHEVYITRVRMTLVLP